MHEMHPYPQEEHMKATNEFILSGRYELLRPLGQGSDGIVYLARHLSLEMERAIKVMPKKTAPSLFAISEANVLKAIQHPGIPIIYDLEQDESNYYLVEEYIRGESLDQFLLHQQSISQNLFFKFCEQLCDIFQYLHTLCPCPILYQDLKPEHIIVSGMQIKLIDFSVSSFISNSENDSKHFGNVAFSAPELLANRKPTPASDIYSIGRLIEWMTRYVDTALPQSVLTIIHKATSAEPDLRYETVDDLSSAIHQANDNRGGMHLRQTIAVIGSHSGCGTTHIAVSLVCALNALGQTAIYYEKNSTDTLRKAVGHMPHMWEHNGCYYQGYFAGYPLYGEGVTVPEPATGITVHDYGHHIPSTLSAADQVLFVCGGAPWHRFDTSLFLQFPTNMKKRLHIVANLCDRKSALYYAKCLDAPVFLYPYDTNPFGFGSDKKRFVDWLLHQKGDWGLFLHVKNLLYRLPGQ